VNRGSEDDDDEEEEEEEREEKKVAWRSGDLAMEDDVWWWLRLWQRWWPVLATGRGRRRSCRGERKSWCNHHVR
jgi:hypothetical protein